MSIPFLIQLENVFPHAVTRGVGANQHESHEVGKAELLFVMPAKHDYDGVAAITDKWFSPTTSKPSRCRHAPWGVRICERRSGLDQRGYQFSD